MKGGIRIGTIFGIPLFVHPSWFVIMALAAWLYAIPYAQILSSAAWPLGIITALLLFASVFLHELGHSLVAKAQGIEVESITLFLFGGVATIKSESKDPFSAFSVAIAGPLVSLALSLLLFGIAWFLGGAIVFSSTSKTVASLIETVGIGKLLGAVLALNLAQINLVLFIFNMLPGLPLDGGQVLKAIVWKVTGNRFTGIIWAARSGQILSYIAIFLGIDLLIRGGMSFNGIWLILLGWMGLNNSTGYLQYTNIQKNLLEITAESAMTRDFRIVDADMTLRQFADEFLIMQEKETQPIYFAASNGRDRGVVSPEDIRFVDRSEWSELTLQSIVKPLKSLDAVELNTKIPAVISLLESKALKYITVFSPVGSVAGIIDHGDVIRALSRKLNWRIPESYIQKVKSEGKFPPDLRLAELSAQISS